MAKRKLVVFYNGDSENQEIAETDYKDFYENLEMKIIPMRDFHIDSYSCPNANVLLGKIRKLIDPKQEDANELYFHFSGHGTKNGIPYDDWILENVDLVPFLSHDRIRFCFFSSCKSTQLVKLANLENIPIVIGTRDENDIENSFAITFQNHFYDLLLKKENFFKAFTLAATLSKTNQQQEGLAGNPIVRGEMAAEDFNKSGVNAMQIIFAEEQQTEWRMLPRNFIDEMQQLGSQLPQLVVWSDEANRAVELEKSFNVEGIDEFVNYIQISEEEVLLFKEMGADDPFVLEGQRTLHLDVSKKQPLPDEIGSYIGRKEVFGQEHFRVTFSLADEIGLDDFISTKALKDQILAHQDHVFKDILQPKLLFENESFLNLIQRHGIGFNERKKIALNFETPPVKDELKAKLNAEKKLRIFFGKNVNENLMHYLINWFNWKEKMFYPVYVVDNILGTNIDIFNELHSQIIETLGSNKNIGNLLQSGVVILIKFRGLKEEIWKEKARQFVSSVSAIWNITPINVANYVFFLRDEDGSVESAEPKIHMHTFSTPKAVTADEIKNWKTIFGNNSINSDLIADTVTEIAKKLGQIDFKDCCPSKAIEFVCQEFELPQRQIIGI